MFLGLLQLVAAWIWMRSFCLFDVASSACQRAIDGESRQIIAEKVENPNGQAGPDEGIADDKRATA